MQLEFLTELRSLPKIKLTLIAICLFYIILGAFILRDNHTRFHFNEISWNGITYKVTLDREGYVTLNFTRAGAQRPVIKLGRDVVDPFFFVYDLDRDGYDEVFYWDYHLDGFIDYNYQSDSLEFIELGDTHNHRDSVAPAMRDLRFQDLRNSGIVSSFFAFLLMGFGLFGCFKFSRTQDASPQLQQSQEYSGE
ncbi:MAG: hypothetical protein AAGG51_11125 [Cyanobacteria bacterium P01_G01_bin.54]